MSEDEVLDASFWSIEKGFDGKRDMLKACFGGGGPPSIEVDDGKPMLEANAENMKNTFRFLMGSKTKSKKKGP